MPDRLEGLRLQGEPVITRLAQEFEIADFIHELVFPSIDVPSEKIKIPIMGKEHMKPENSKRALRARSNRIQPVDRTTQPHVIEERDLEQAIDYREIAESDFDEKREAAMLVKEKTELGLEKDCADLLQDSTKYPANHVVVLSGTSQFTDYSNSDPIAVSRVARKQHRQSTGKLPNTLVLGFETFEVLQYHPKLLEKIQYVQQAMATEEHMAKFFGVQRVVVGQAVYADPETEEFIDLWKDIFWMGYVNPNPPATRTKRQRSFGYKLRKKGSQRVDSYYEVGGKLTLVRYTDIVDPHIISNDCGYLVEDCCA